MDKKPSPVAGSNLMRSSRFILENTGLWIKKTMSKPVNQHWVPQFYLKYFATPDTQKTKNPKAWIFSKDNDGDPFLTNIKNICAKRYLYSPFDKDGQRDWGLETELSDLESLLSVVWPILAEGYADLQSQPIRKAVALFISVMYLRHPDNLQECADTHNHLVQLYEQAPKKADRTPDIDFIEINGEKQKIDVNDWHEYRNWQKNDHHKFFSDSIRSHAKFIAELCLKKRWSVIVSEMPSFITSDKPVCKNHLDKDKFGFGTEGTILTFPLSPTRLLIMDDMHHEPAGQYYPLHDDGPGPYNLGIWRNGSRFMISQRDIDEVLLEMLDWADRQDKD